MVVESAESRVTIFGGLDTLSYDTLTRVRRLAQRGGPPAPRAVTGCSAASAIDFVQNAVFGYPRVVASIAVS
jgi:hypothetical protein